MKVRRLDRRGKGYTRIEWLLDYYEGPKRIRKWYKSKGEAEAAMDEIKGQHKVAGQTWVELAPEERNDLMTIYAEAKREGISLRTVWEAYKTGKLDASPMQRRTLAQAIKETIDARRTEGVTDEYLKGLESYLKRFADGRTEMFVDKIGPADINDWFSKSGGSVSANVSNMGRLGSMFDVCFKRSYINDNPILRIDKPKVREGKRERFTAVEAKALLTEAKQRPASLGYFVLAMFAGIRPEELEALKWSAFKPEGSLIHVPAEAAKKKIARDVPLHPTCLAWLKTIKRKSDAPIAPPSITLRRHRRALRDKLGKWPQDVLRHTAASFLVEHHQNKEQVAKWLGNSVRTLEKNYLSYVSKSECLAFWALTPKAIK